MSEYDNRLAYKALRYVEVQFHVPIQFDTYKASVEDLAKLFRGELRYIADVVPVTDEKVVSSLSFSTVLQCQTITLGARALLLRPLKSSFIASSGYRYTSMSESLRGATTLFPGSLNRFAFYIFFPHD